MATAEALFHEAQHEFNSISFEDSRKNRRHAAKAKSLAKKILRKYPDTPEAQVAASILWRLGDETYASGFRHTHAAEPFAGKAVNPEPHRHNRAAPISAATDADGDAPELDWARLVAWLFKLPKAVLAGLFLVALFLFGIFGFLLVVPLVVVFLLTGPLRRHMDPANRQQVNRAIVAINAFVGSDRRA